MYKAPATIGTLASDLPSRLFKFSVVSQSSSDSPRQPSGHHICEGREASCRLNIVIVGCGLGGIAAAYSLSQAGHNVTILEATREIREVGVGVILSPSITRLLASWGAADALRKIGIPTSGIAHLRSTDGEMMAYTPFGEQAEAAYGSPNMFVHRADFHKILSDLALPSPRVRLQLRARVSCIDPVPDSYGKVSVTLATGEIVSGDLVIGADGIKSLTRQAVVGHPDPPEPSGDAAYRATVPADKLLSDPDLRSLVENHDLTSWIGKNTRLVGYPIVSAFYPFSSPSLTSVTVFYSIEFRKAIQPRSCPPRRRNEIMCRERRCGGIEKSVCGFRTEVCCARHCIQYFLTGRIQSTETSVIRRGIDQMETPGP